MAEEKIYPYAVARIRVLEKNLLSKQTLNQMADEKEIESCLRTLTEYGYDNVPEGNAREFEQVLSAELSKTYAVIRELVPEEKFINIFLYKNDYQNLKVLLKEEVSGIDGTQYIVQGGTEPVEKLKQSILDRKYTDLPKIMGEAIEEALELYSKTQSGQMIDIALDRGAFRQMAQSAKESENDFVMGYTARVCDLTNLKSFLRMRHMNKDFGAFMNVFVEGGELSSSVFFNAYGTDNPTDQFKGTRYDQIFEIGVEKGFTEFEKMCDDFIMDYVKSAKYIALTLEPLIAYLYAKESEIKTVRIILTSKLNQISSEIIKERVREAYV